jgi:formyl-CoA transferase
MVAHYDVFVENYGPGVIEKLDIGYDVMRELNPGIIYGRLKGFGLSGPYSGYKSYDWVAQASAGAFAVTGYADTPPTMPGPTIGDSGTGMQMALAITAAYVEKQRTGQGQFIEIAMQEAVTMFMRTQGLAQWGTGVQPRTGIHGAPPTGVYRCKGAGPNDYLFIMVVTSRMWDTLCAAIGKPELLDDPRFATGIDRVQNGEALKAEIEDFTSNYPKHEAMQMLASAGVPCSATMDHLDLFTDPHLTEREFIQKVDHPSHGEVTLMRNPIRMRGVEPLRPAPDLGAHTDEILAADLGLTPSELGELRASGITDMAKVAAD